MLFTRKTAFFSKPGCDLRLVKSTLASEKARKSFFSCYLRVVGAGSRRRGMQRGPAGGAALATAQLVAPSHLVGLEPTGHPPQEGEAMRLRSKVRSLHVAASDADGGGANGLGRGRTSSDAMCMWALAVARPVEDRVFFRGEALPAAKSPTARLGGGHCQQLNLPKHVYPAPSRTLRSPGPLWTRLRAGCASPLFATRALTAGLAFFPTKRQIPPGRGPGK